MEYNGLQRETKKIKQAKEIDEKEKEQVDKEEKERNGR